MRKSCIVQRKNSRLVVLHEDYIEICDGNMIAAMILSILIYWTDVKLAQREQEQEQRKATGEDIPLTSLWIWKSQEGFQHDLLVDKPGMRQVHRSTIATALSLLKDKKFIQARRNPHNNIDRTQQYLIEQDAINEAIKALPDCTIFSTRMSEIVQSNVGNQSMDCTETDNGLPNFRQTIPENTNREYDTEITEQREREVATATARSQSSSGKFSNAGFYSPIPMTYNEALAYLVPHGPHEGLDAVQVVKLAQKLWVEAHEDDEDTVEREAVKPSQKEVVRGHHQHRASDNHLTAHSDLPDPVQPKPRQEDTNKVGHPPAPSKAHVNTSPFPVPKRARPQSNIMDEIPLTPDEQVVFDAWCSLFKVEVPLIPANAKASKQLVKPLQVWTGILDKSTAEVLKLIMNWAYKNDKNGYYKRGFKLYDAAREFEAWQSAQERPQGDKEESNEHKAVQHANAFIARGYDKEYNKRKLEEMRAENERRRQAAGGVQS